MNHHEKGKKVIPQLMLDENGNNLAEDWIGKEMNYASSMPQKTTF